MTQKEMETCLPFYKELTSQQKELILQSADTRLYEKGRILTAEGSSCQGFIIVKTGEISASMISEDGREAELFTLPAGDFCIFTASCLFLPKSFHVQMVAAQKSEVIIIPSASVEKLRSQNIHVELFAYKTMTARFANVMTATEEMLFVPVEKRLAKYLSAAQSPIKITQEELARKLGTAREVVSRLLSSLRRDGIIETQRGQIKIIKPFLLKELALK